MGSTRSEVMAARQHEIQRALVLALVPLGATLLLGMLLFPRQAAPDALPLPIADPHALRQTLETDAALAARARNTPLPGVVRALGSALRDFHMLEGSKSVQQTDLVKARHTIDAALIDAQSAGAEPLLELRAVQLEAFVAEVRRFVSTGVESPELGALAGDFVHSMRAEGWCDGHRLALADPQLRALFKQMWNSLLGASEASPLALTLDEQRSLFALRLSQPRLPPRLRDGFARSKQAATSERSCRNIEESELKALEKWEVDHIDKIAAIDPIYPAAYARGIANLQGGSFAAAQSSFREWLSIHPDGPLTLRARSYLRLASRASQVE